MVAVAGAFWWVWAWAIAYFLKAYPILMAFPFWWWGRRRTVILSATIFFASIVGWAVFSDGVFAQQFAQRDVGGTFIGRQATPYAGWNGVQGFVNATVWKLSGRSFEPVAIEAPARLADPVFLINGAIAGAFGLVCLWAMWRTRHRFSVPCLMLLALTWFVGYRDVWEHHLMMLQPLVGLLIAGRFISVPSIIVAWMCLGAPSLWLPIVLAGYHSTPAAEALNLAYYAQRPLGVLLLSVLMVRRIIADTSNEVTVAPPDEVA
jgi:hypothetical protein